MNARYGMFLAVLAMSCGGSAGKCGDSGPYPAPPAGVHAVWHVDAQCPDEGADGSGTRPFRTLGRALESAGAGDAILVAPGEYREAVRLPSVPLWIAGYSDPASPDAFVSLAPPDAPGDAKAAVTMIGPGGGVPERTTISGVRIEVPFLAGIRVQGGSLAVRDCRIAGARPVPASGKYGFGIVASKGADLVVAGCTIEGSAAEGLLASESAVVVEDSVVSNNGGAGIRLQSCATGAVEVRDCRILGNREFGVGVLSSKAVVEGNEIGGTRKSATGGLGDGIVVGELLDSSGEGLGPSEVELAGNDVHDNERMGIVLDGRVAGSVTGNQSRLNASGGIWIQNGAGKPVEFRVEGNALSGNTGIGIAVLTGARAAIRDNELGGTLPATTLSGGATVRFAYGAGIFSDGTAEVAGNRFLGFEDATNVRVAHVLVDSGGAGTVVTGNLLGEGVGALHVAVQNQPDSAKVVIQDNAGSEEIEYPPKTNYVVTEGMLGGVGMVGPGGGPPE
jgi:hypothetical protein